MQALAINEIENTTRVNQHKNLHIDIVYDSGVAQYKEGDYVVVNTQDKNLLTGGVFYLISGVVIRVMATAEGVLLIDEREGFPNLPIPIKDKDSFLLGRVIGHVSKVALG